MFSAAVCMKVSAGSFSKCHGTVLLHNSATFRRDTFRLLGCCYKSPYLEVGYTGVSCDGFIAVANHLGTLAVAIKYRPTMQIHSSTENQIGTTVRAHS